MLLHRAGCAVQPLPLPVQPLVCLPLQVNAVLASAAGWFLATGLHCKPSFSRPRWHCQSWCLPSAAAALQGLCLHCGPSLLEVATSVNPAANPMAACLAYCAVTACTGMAPAGKNVRTAGPDHSKDTPELRNDSACLCCRACCAATACTCATGRTSRRCRPSQTGCAPCAATCATAPSTASRRGGPPPARCTAARWLKVGY